MSHAPWHDRSSAEELREVLLDLDRAREYERQMRLQTEGLLEGLRVLSRAANTRQLFDELTAVLQRFVPFEAVFLLRAETAPPQEPPTKIAISRPIPATDGR